MKKVLFFLFLGMAAFTSAIYLILLVSYAKQPDQVCLIEHSAILQSTPGIVLGDGTVMAGEGLVVKITGQQDSFYRVKMPVEYGGAEGYIPADRCIVYQY